MTATALCPGLVHTGFHAAAGIDETQWKAPLWLDAERVAIDGLAAVRRGQVICTRACATAAPTPCCGWRPAGSCRRAVGPEHSGQGHD